MYVLTTVVLSLLSTVIADGTDKVSVDVYYESLCPDSMKFIVNQLNPASPSLNNYMKLELIPYGHANYTMTAGNYSFNCQHGAVECYGNKVQACGLHYINGDKLKFVVCLMESTTKNMPHQDSDYPTKLCANLSDYQKIVDCANSTEGDSLLAQMGNMTTSGLNKDKFPVPYIVFNKTPDDDINVKAMSNFSELLCSYIKTDKPELCKRSGADAVINSILLLISAVIITRIS